MVHTGDSQSLTPFGSQPSLSSHGGPIGGLVLPTSSPDAPGGFRLEGDNEPGSVGGPSALFGAGEMTDLLEPDFAFGDDGEIIDVPPRNALFRTPGVPGGTAMPSDAGASARVRREHEEGQRAGAQVSFTALSHCFSVLDLASMSCVLPLHISPGLVSWGLHDLTCAIRCSCRGVSEAVVWFIRTLRSNSIT
jgi:hypothetical protein